MPSRESERTRCRWRGPLAPLGVTIAILACVYGGSPNFRWETGPLASPFGGDFLQEWLGGYIVRAGDCSRFYDVRYAQELQHDPRLVGFAWDRQEYLPIVYPPFYYLLVSPLSQFPPRVAVWIWAAIMSGCLVVTVCLVSLALGSHRGFLGEIGGKLAAFGRGSASRQRSAWMGLWLLPMALLYGPTVLSLVSSQKATLCLLVLTGSFVLLDRRQPMRAGVVFGLLAFKPQLTLVIGLAMLYKRQWRFVCGGCATGLALVALCALLGGNVCMQYLQFSRSAARYVNTPGYDTSRSHCLDGFIVELAGGTATTLTRVATMIASTAVVALSAWLLRGCSQPGSRQFALQFSGLVIATILLSPHLFAYDLTLLLLPMLVLGLIAAAEELPSRRALAVGVIGLFVAPAVSGVTVMLLGLQLTVVAMVGLLTWLAFRIAGPPRGSTITASKKDLELCRSLEPGI